jgi:hypothetical protein
MSRLANLWRRSLWRRRKPCPIVDFGLVVQVYLWQEDAGKVRHSPEMATQSMWNKEYWEIGSMHSRKREIQLI